jgi:fucose 4-O-acetylase-like acetyltransferase
LTGTEKQRVLWVDFAKCLGIWLVVFGHTAPPEYLHQFIFAFHMPLFFFISGYLEKNGRDIKQEASHGIKTLLIPYVILYLILFAFDIGVRQRIGAVKYNGSRPIFDLIIKPILGMFLGVGQRTPYSYMIDMHLWFLPALFCVKIIHRVIYTLVKGRLDYYLSSLGIVLILMFGLQFTQLFMPFSLSPALLTFPFFAVGNMMRHKNTLKCLLCSKLCRILVIPIGFIIVALVVPYNGPADTAFFRYGKDALLFYILGFTGILSTICLSSFYKKQNWFVITISNGTIILLAFHHLISLYLTKMAGLVGLPQSLTIKLVISLLTLCVALIPIKFIQRFIPIIMGGRK